MQLLPKFQELEIFEMLSDHGHRSLTSDRSTDRFWSKFNAIKAVYQIPKTEEFMQKIRGCIRDEVVRREL